MIRNLIKNLKAQMKSDKKAFVIYSILRVLVLLTLLRCIHTRNFESAVVCGVSLILFYIPPAFEKALNIEIPTLFEIIIYLFIFAAEILGEIDHYYVLIPGWDTMLHTMNGFLCAVVGFSLVDILNQKSKAVDLSPFYVAMAGFCFSMTIGVLWEFFEFGMDHFFAMDMQKDFIVSAFSSVTLDPNNMGEVVRVEDITETIIKTASGKTFTIHGGYLDIGIADTMKDLFVNFIGAIVFSVIGYISINSRKDKRARKIADELIIRRQ